ncbi:CSEP0139 putative effector protein [Blumeria hordei DH14]|uniref:CSEP0139 putative effector protein n=1 Tax=Blumeria graminis f. sp. hordei (strain DH14) TaxID=546991 RepID=N1JDZ7_BLUG1|nr:CSEP0139 putative effector protein [Blumeria hordei DH14]
MKVLLAASTAGLAAFLLLVPTAYGLHYFKCNSRRIFAYSVIVGYTDSATYEQIQAGDPHFAGGHTYGAYRFTDYLPDGSPRNYLVQMVNVNPYYRLFESSGGRWHICTMEGS